MCKIRPLVRDMSHRACMTNMCHLIWSLFMRQVTYMSDVDGARSRVGQKCSMLTVALVQDHERAAAESQL